VSKMVRATTATVVLSALIAALASAGAGEAQEVGPADERAKNIIIFIGDGMGTSHRDLVRSQCHRFGLAFHVLTLD
jgi:alkaline phosphatase